MTNEAPDLEYFDLSDLHSHNVGNIALALAKVQAQLVPAIKDSENPYFRSKYADLNAVWASCRKALAENDIAVVQSAHCSPTPRLVTMLMHKSGEYITSEWPLTPTKQNDPQSMGSAITYMRRYSLASMVGVVVDEDDDGNAASDRQPQQRQQRQQAKPQPAKKAAPPQQQANGLLSKEQASQWAGSMAKLGVKAPEWLEAAKQATGRDIKSALDLTEEEAKAIYGDFFKRASEQQPA